MAQNVPQNVPQSPFDRALNIFKKDLTKRDKENFKIATFQDLQKSIDDLQKTHQSTRRIQDLSRLGVFLEAIEQYTKVVEPFCNSNEIVAFILGPIKFLLLVASSYQKAFQELVNTYESLGDSIPLLLQYQELFRTKPHMTRVLSLMYEDILSFHRLAMKYFQQRLWKQLFDATWPSHRSRFASVIENLARHRTLIERHATLSQIEDSQESQRLANDRFDIMMQNEDMTRAVVVSQWLKSPHTDVDQYNFTKVRLDYPDSGKWLLDNQSFQEWFDPSFPKIPPLLWISGIPGSGKTILASSIVEQAQRLSTKPTVLFFYCKHDDPEHDNFLSLARGILAQILHQDKDLLTYFYEERSKSKEAVLSVPDQVRRLLALAFQRCKNTYIILDGLDECKRDDRKEIVQWFIRLVEKLPVNESSRIRCLFTSRDDGPGRKDFDGMFSLSIRQEDMREDLQHYCHFQAEKLKTKLWLSLDRTQEISETVFKRAGAMFLLARLIWDSLLEATSIESLEEQLDPTRLPVDIYDAYVYPTHLSLWHDSFALGLSGLADILFSFLVDERIVDPLYDDIEMGSLCLSYLNLPVFMDSITSNAASQGDYGLMDYAVIYWIKHLDGVIGEASRRMTRAKLQDSHRAQAISQEQDRSIIYPTLQEDNYPQAISPFAEALGVFVDEHWVEPKISLEVSSRNKKKLQVFEDRDFYENLEQIYVFTRKQLHSFGALKKDEISTDIADIVREVRDEIEKAFTSAMDKSSKDSVVEKYGENLFKCPRLSCRSFTSGFATTDERDHHVEWHDLPFRCNDKNCITGFDIGFANQTQYKRHMRIYHQSTFPQHEQFPTDKEIQQSKQGVIQNKQARTQPAPASSSTRPPDPTLQGDTAAISGPEESSSSDSEPPEIRPLPRVELQPEDLKCPTCSREFTKLYNLRSHMRVHQTIRPFSCEFCPKTFTRKNDCTRHRKIHLGTRDWVCGGCQQAFSRSDVLNTHFQSQKGQACLQMIAQQQQEN
ncbi:uncharacterized protein N7503_001393 [Penicillium pulvis]|uniref:uncharacterized protein n=1 Tax=Penicillium pulvis TaxID=1562058 RepID=UPI0025493731|nr:uncharacterized protein N7503_001393 [Penicillium pulvis]KAJ5809175.1 hypothetical protein N7503_001393 [Penicillium pulvis]